MAHTQPRRQPPVLASGGQRWWRHESYIIADGMIRPEPGAKLTGYALDEGGVEARKTQPAYEKLVLAVREMPTHSSGWPVRRPLTKGEEKAILGFCSRYGLLGLLPHQVRSVVFAARQREYDGEDGLPYFMPYQTRYVRTARGWVDATRGVVPLRFPDPGNLDLGYESAVNDELTDEYDDDVFEVPRALVRPLGWYDEEARPIEDAMSPYFPSVPKVNAGIAAYPLPTTETFWTMYSEPVHEFLRAAIMLARVFEKVALNSSDTIQTDLDSLVAPVMLVVEPGERGVPVQKIATPSLLSALAIAAISAASKGLRLVRCAGCEILFFTDAYQRRYHDDVCAWRVHARTYRAKKKVLADGSAKGRRKHDGKTRQRKTVVMRRDPAAG